MLARSVPVAAAPPATRPWLIAALSLGSVLVQLDVSVVNVATHAIRADLHSSVAALQWVIDGYTLTLATLLLTAGALCDRLGARRMYIAGMVLFGAASIGCALAPDMGELVAARVGQGIGAAMLFPASLTLLNHNVAPERRLHAVSLWAAGGSTAMALGPIVGGVLVDTLGWRAVFAVNVPVVAVTIALTMVTVRESSIARRRLDLPGQILITVCVAALVAAVIRMGEASGASTVALFASAILALFGFAAAERLSSEPMVPLGLFRSHRLTISVAIGFLINIGVYGLLFVFALYFQNIRRYSAESAGLAFLPLMTGIVAANLVAARLIRRFGPARVLQMSTAAATAAALTLALALDLGYPILAVALAVLGFALGSLVPAITSETLAGVDPSRSGLASGLLNSARQCGSALGVALFGTLAASNLTAGLRTSLWITVALGAAMVLLGALMQVRDRRA